MGTVDKLLGAWEWQYSLSGWTGEYSDEINKGLSLEFEADGTLLVNEDGQLARTITWHLQTSGDGYVSLVAEPFELVTFGFVLFCDDQLLFNGSPMDGADSYFKSLK